MPTLRDHGPVSGRIVAAQLAVAAVLLAAVSRSPLVWSLAVPAAVASIALVGLRWRGRWLYAWLGTGLRYLGRPRTLPAGAGATAMLAFVEPTACSGPPPGVIEDSDGVVAIVELGGAPAHPDVQPALPSPAELVRASGAGSVALVVSAVPAGGAGPAGASYRQLTDGRVPARQRALLAVRACRTGVAWNGDELRRALDGSLRRIDRRLSRDGIAHRQVPGDAAVTLLAEVALPAEAAEVSGAVREEWTGIRLGGLHQTCLRVAGFDRLGVEVAEQLIARLLALPAASVTIGWCASAAGSELTVRVAAGTRAGLVAAVTTAYRGVTTAGAVADGLDGRQLDGLASTLPLARPPLARPQGQPSQGQPPLSRPPQGQPPQGRPPQGQPPQGRPPWGRPPLGRPHPDGSAPALPALAPTGRSGAIPPEPGGAPRLTLAASGLVLGYNRHQQPVTVRLFRPEPTRAMVLGGLPAAQVLTLRALALNAQVLVQTVRPQAWEPFARAVSLPTGAVALVPPGSPVPAPLGPLVPQLVVVDAGAPGAPAVPPVAWRASLVLREQASTADVAELSRADLVILQPLRPDEATLVGAALGLAASRDWLTRLRADMVGAVSRVGTGRSAVRWAVLSTTDIERQVIGAPERVAAS